MPALTAFIQDSDTHMPAGGDCDLITPQSTVKGKGYWGDVEGFEALLNLTKAGDTFVNRPLNYRRVQVHCSQAVLHMSGACLTASKRWMHSLLTCHARVRDSETPCVHAQDALTKAGCVGASAVMEEKEIHEKKPGFSGGLHTRLPIDARNCTILHCRVQAPPCQVANPCRVFLWRAASYTALGI